MTESLARASSRRPWFAVGLWLLVILAAFVLVAMFLAFEGEAEITRTTESKQAERILDEGFPQEAANGQAITEIVVVRAEDGQVRSAATRTRVAALANELRAAGAARVVTYGEERRLVSQAATRQSSSWPSAGTERTTSRKWSTWSSASTRSPATGRP
jgi:uncharacterized membrane protein YdfJ with MMPL/SSD domain